jgi:hypothetical protein
MRRDRPPEPWHSFFRDIDKIFEEPIALQCIGGFAMATLYGLPRPTVDVDFLSLVPAGEIGRLDALAGRDRRSTGSMACTCSMWVLSLSRRIMRTG